MVVVIYQTKISHTFSLMYYLWESLTGKPVSVAWQRGLQKVGLALLVFIMALAFFNDLTRLFT